MTELNSEWVVSISFAFKQLLRALFMTPIEFDVSSLKSTIKGLGTDEKVCTCITLAFINPSFLYRKFSLENAPAAC